MAFPLPGVQCFDHSHVFNLSFLKEPETKPAEWVVSRWGRFISLRIYTRWGFIFFVLWQLSFLRISFVFSSKKHHLSSRGHKKGLIFCSFGNLS